MRKERGTEEEKPNHITVDVWIEKPKLTLMRIMKLLRNNLYLEYTIRAKGRENTKACEDIVKKLTRWIVVEDVKSWRDK